jgi:hypothetical protein
MTEEIFKSEISKRPPTESEMKQKLGTTGANIYLYKGNTLETLPKATSEISPVDFVWIDGGHSRETVASDWNAVARLMHEKTVVIFDDYWVNRADQGAKPIVDSIDIEKYNVEILPIEDRFDNTDFGELVIRLAKVTKR